MQKLFPALLAATMLAGQAVAQTPAASNSQTPAATSNTTPATGMKPAMPGSTTAPANAANSNATTTTKAAGAPTMSTAGKLSYYTVQSNDMRVSELIGTDVFNQKNENIGEIEDVLMDSTKNIRGVVISVGGFLGIGDRNIAVEPASLTTTKQGDGELRVTLHTTKEDLQNAPQVDLDKLDKQASATVTGSTSNNAATGMTDKPAPSAPKSK